MEADRPLHFEIRRTRFRRRFYVVIRAPGNRRVLAHSQGYRRKESAERMIEIIQRHARTSTVEDLTV